MCLAIPMKVKEIEGAFAQVQTGTILRRVNIQMLPGIKKGDYCLVHAGFAIQKVDAKKARESLESLK